MIKYNKINKNDVEFHKKIHKKQEIPVCEKIAQNFYQKGNKFFYGEKTIKSSCKIRKNGDCVTLLDFFYDSIESRDSMIKLLKILFLNIAFE